MPLFIAYDADAASDADDAPRHALPCVAAAAIFQQAD